MISSVLTPSGESVDLENLGRSRSGRLIKPPLQWWTGQTLELDGENISVKAPTIASSLFLQQFEDGYKVNKVIDIETKNITCPVELYAYKKLL